MNINYAGSETVDTYPREVPPPPPPPPQYPSQRVRKETSQLRVPSMGCSVEIRSPQSSQRSSTIRQRGITPGRIDAATPTASSANLHSTRQVAHQPRIPTRGSGEQRPALVYAPASHASRVLRSIPTPKVGVDKTPADPKHTPLLSRLLPPGFACAASSPDGSSSTASVQTVRTADESEQGDHSSMGHEDRTRRTGESARLTSGDQKPHSQRYKPRAARFAPSHASGVTSHPIAGPHSGLSERADAVQLKAGQSLTYALRDEISSYYRHDPTDSGDPEGREDLVSSPHSGSTVPSTTESQEALSDKHGYGSDQIPERKLSSEEGDREEPLRCSADEDEVEGETGSKTDDRSPDSETQLTLCAPEVSGFPKMFHRIPHAYVNDEQALAAAELDVNPLFYTGYEDEPRLRRADNKVTDTRSELTCVGPPPSYPSTVVVEIQAPHHKTNTSPCCFCSVPCEIDPSASYLSHGARPKRGFSNASRVGAPAAFVISTAPHDHPPRFTIVNGRPMHCSSERGPVSAAVCDSLLGSSKLESASATAGRGVSDSSPSIQNVPGELDIQFLWEENQQLKALLHEATTRLQYVNVLECHLQRLNMLVGSMLASHHRQCELDHQLHGCPHQEFFPAESRPRAPPPPSQPPPTDWMYPVVPSSLPAVPIAPYYSPGYYPFNVATPAVIPERSIHMGPVQPGWNVRPQMMFAPDSSGRSTRSRVNTSAWPRTVSLDRADGVGGYSSGYSSRWSAANVVPDRRSAQPKKHSKQKTVRVADEPITFTPDDRSQQPLPFRSVQVTRRRLDHSVPASNAHLSPRPSGACETHYCPHSGRELFRETNPLIKYQPPMSSPAQTNRPMDISLINRYPDLEEQEDMKHLTPHTETIPAKIAVSSVYQVASACRVCLADSGVHSGDSQTQLAPVGQTGIVVSTTLSNTYMPPQIGSSLQASTDYAIHSSAGGPTRYVFAVSGTQPNVEAQAESRPVANSVNAASEADGSGSYEGITLPQPTHAKRPSETNLPHSTQTTTSTSETLSTAVPFTANEQSAQVHFARHTPSTLSPKLRFSSPSFTHSLAHGGPSIRTKHSEHFPFSEASPEAIYTARSPTSPLSMNPTVASERSQDTVGRTGQFPGYCFGGSTKVNEVMFDPLQADSRYAPHSHRQGPHAAPHPCDIKKLSHEDIRTIHRYVRPQVDKKRHPDVPSVHRRTGGSR
ncbi:hypothetical protein X801_04179 [Opisthorchis viverrini]|uniref:Uncharacterized protein n=1 Tax=Opisthorchis viverrini TaxID=6198 RepID=A0A1S8WZR7_OPIVI|nr:hypothetical protein X801_04179 [Opisthorchis viverrini]